MHSCTRRRRRDQLLSIYGKSLSYCPPAPPRPSTHKQLSALRPARLHAVSTRVVPSVTSSQLHLRISSRRPKLVFGHRCSSARAASSSHIGRVENSSFFQMMHSFPVGLVIGCPIISRLDHRHVLIIRHVALPMLNLVHHFSGCSLRSPSQGSYWQPTLRPSCISRVHQFCDSSVACSTTCCSST